MAVWRELWQAPPLDGGEEAERRHTAFTLIRAGTVLMAILLVASILLDPMPPGRHESYFMLLLVHVLTLLLLRRGELIGAVITFAALYLITVFATMWGYGGVRAPTGFVLPPLVLFVGLTLSGRAAVATALAASGGMIGLVVLEQRGVLPEAQHVPSIRIALVAMTALVITGVMLFHALRVIRVSRARAAADQEARHALEQRLLQSRRLEAVGRLAAGVAHDFNNLLTVVFAEASRLRRGDERTAASAANIATAAERASALTRQLLAFGRRQATQPQVLDPNEVIAELQKLLGTFLGEQIRLEVVLDPEIDRVRADRTEMEQVLLNLVTNARDAMPKGGVVTVRTGRAEGGGVIMEVIDTGGGIDPSDQPHLFEPFFTTKPVGKGTGLGLSTVNDIVTRAGGSIHVVSVIGAGTRFSVTLPSTRDEPVRARAQVRTPPPAAGAPVILIVDDDPQVRGALQTVIADAGYTARIARSAGELLAEADQWKRAPDLLLTDVVMSGMTGPELVRRLRGRFPDLRALFMSGYAEEGLSERGVISEGVHFISKPLALAPLLDKIARVLASSNPGSLGSTA